MTVDSLKELKWTVPWFKTWRSFRIKVFGQITGQFGPEPNHHSISLRNPVPDRTKNDKFRTDSDGGKAMKRIMDRFSAKQKSKIWKSVINGLLILESELILFPIFELWF